MQGDCGRAEQLYREAVARCRALGEHVNTAEALLGLAHIAIDRGDLPLAAAHYEEALALVEGVRYATSVAAIARTGYGFLMRGLDNLPRAHKFLCESLTAWHILADPGSIAVCLEAIAGVVCELGAPARAVNLLGAAEVIREQFGFPIPEGGRDTYRQTVAGVQSRLRMHDFAIAWNVGRGLSVDEAVLLAIEEPEAHAEPPPRRPKALGLTERERQVLRLIVAGHSNQAIADALFVSRRTITTHVASILRKLDVPTRSAAAARAEREQLI
jgi:DNA-binding CsgD family transcriptional regulator